MKKIGLLSQKMEFEIVFLTDVKLANKIWFFSGLSKKATCLRGRVAVWPKLISADVYDGGPSRKVKTLKNRPLLDP